jgi:beta-lactamase class A
MEESRERASPQGDTTENRREQDGSDKVPVAREVESETREILSRYPGDYGVVLWQPESGIRISLDAGKRFKSASLAKLPVLLALYREAAEGRLSLDERIEMSESDIQPGTGALQYRPPGTTLTLREYAEYLIKESDNTAWNILEDRLGKKRIRAELARVGAESTSYEYAGHMTTPDDTLKILQKISDPGYTSPSHSQEMLDAMTNTAFEDRLPQGLPANARIQHKIGSLGDNFGDAGLVMPPEGKEYGGPYYVVVLSRNAGGEANARGAMREISLTAYQGLVDPEARPRSPIPGSGSERRQQ